MAGKPNGKPRGKGKQFQPGQSGNPLGRPAIPKELVAFRTTTYQDFLSALQYYGSMTDEQLDGELRRPTLTKFDRMFATMVDRAANGCRDTRKELLERLWGKVKDNVEISTHEVDETLDKIDREVIMDLLKA